MASNLLSHFNVTTINFARNCSNIALGVTVYDNYFSQAAVFNYNATGDVPATPSNSGPTEYSSISPNGWSGWNAGPPPEWIQFWRGALPLAYQKSSDQEIAQWANTSLSLEFFDLTYNPSNSHYGDLSQVDLDDVDAFSNALASSGGCQNNITYLADDRTSEMQDFGNSYALTDMIEDCMITFCCPLNSTVLSDQSRFFPGTNWPIESACSFYRCAIVNMGNPDLGGIGILVAYYIEAILLTATWAMTVLQLLVLTTCASRPGSSSSSLFSILSSTWDRHFAATLAAATVFLDAAVYFSISVSFAGILFNYRGDPLLYEDKLGQVSTLLAVDAPVTILLLIYLQEGFDRRALRCVLVGISALMTFIIQFMFRSIQSFDTLNSTSCLDWGDSLETPYMKIFVIKAIWAGFVAVFFASHVLSLPLLSRWNITKEHPPTRSMDKSSTSRSKFKIYEHLLTSIEWIYTQRKSLIAILLAAYGVVDSYMDITFIRTLRDAERAIALNDEEDTWGYGQILAVLIWVPILVEYVYRFIRGSKEKSKAKGASGAAGEEMQYLRLRDDEQHVARVHG